MKDIGLLVVDAGCRCWMHVTLATHDPYKQMAQVQEKGA